MNDSEQNNNKKSVVKFNLPFTLIGLFLSGLIGWAFSFIPVTEQLKLTVGIIAFITSAIYLLTFFNVTGSRSATVIKSTAGLIFIVSTIILALMAIWCQSTPAFIITMSIIVLIFLATAMSVAQSGQ